MSGLRVSRYGGAGSNYSVTHAVVPDGPFTVMALVVYASTAGTQTIVSCDANPPRHFQLRNDGFIAFNTVPSAFSASIGSNTVPVGVPTVVFGRATATEASTWVAGNKLSAVAITGTVAGNSSSVSNYEFGGRNAGNNLNGGIAIFVEWARALSDAEIVSISANPWQLFAPQTRRVFAVGSGGTVYNVSITETGAAVDAPMSMAAWLAAVAEAGGSADVSTGAIITSASTVETGAVADTASTGGSTTAVTAEAGAVVDTTSNSLAAAATVAEAGASAEAISALRFVPGAISEAGAGVDAPSASMVTSAAQAEAGGLTDALNFGGGVQSGSIAEAGTGTDTITATAAFAAAVNEAGTGADTPAATAVMSAAISEAGAALDQQTVGGAAVSAAMVEVLSAADVPAALASLSAALVEAGASADLLNTVASYTAAVVETGSAVDVPSARAAFVATTAEVVTAADVLNFLGALSVNPRYLKLAVSRGYKVSATLRRYTVTA